MLDNRLTKTLLLSLLFVFFAFGSSFAYGYFQRISFISSTIVDFEGETPTLQVEYIDQPINVTLVPQGRALLPTQVETVGMNYRLSIDKALARTMDLVVDAASISIGTSSEYAGLIEVYIDGQPMSVTRDIFNEEVVVNATIRLKEPIDAAEAMRRGLPLSAVNVADAKVAYAAIAGQELRVTFRFAIQPKS